MTLEMLARTNDISLWSAARAMINLIERGLVEPNGDRDKAIAELRATMEAHRPRI